MSPRPSRVPFCKQMAPLLQELVFWNERQPVRTHLVVTIGILDSFSFRAMVDSKYSFPGPWLQRTSVSFCLLLQKAARRDLPLLFNRRFSIKSFQSYKILLGTQTFFKTPPDLPFTINASTHTDIY